MNGGRPRNMASRENLNDDYTRPTDKIQLNDKQLKNLLFIY